MLLQCLLIQFKSSFWLLEGFSSTLTQEQPGDKEEGIQINIQCAIYLQQHSLLEKICISPNLMICQTELQLLVDREMEGPAEVKQQLLQDSCLHMNDNILSRD